MSNANIFNYLGQRKRPWINENIRKTKQEKCGEENGEELNIDRKTQKSKFTEYMRELLSFFNSLLKNKRLLLL